MNIQISNAKPAEEARVMERAEWLKQMRDTAEKLCDRISRISTCQPRRRKEDESPSANWRNRDAHAETPAN